MAMYYTATALDRYGRRRHAKDCNGSARHRVATRWHRVEGTRKARAWLGDAWDRMQGKGSATTRAAMAGTRKEALRAAVDQHGREKQGQ